MSGFIPDTTRNGNYKCPYCYDKTRKSYKTHGAAVNHISKNHYNKARIDELKKTIENKNAVIKELTIPPKPKKEYYDAFWYCCNCLGVYTGGLPKNTLIQHVNCGNCGVQALRIVTNLRQIATK